LLLGLAVGSAQNSRDVAIILKSTGDVRVKKSATNRWSRGDRGFRLDSGDIIKTASNSLAAVMFTDDKSLLKVRDNSVLAIRGEREPKTISKRLFCTLGSLWIKVGKQKTNLVVETPSGIAAVKGTEFYCVVDSDGATTIIAIEGIVQLINELGQILVQAGETGKLTKDGAPFKYQSKSEEVPDWGGEGADERELRLEFQDNAGNRKELIIKYQEN
ncbi:MAG: FecR family protein, partial [bacterium]|nr:FecR family protein [bacterium]